MTAGAGACITSRQISSNSRVCASVLDYARTEALTVAFNLYGYFWSLLSFVLKSPLKGVGSLVTRQL